MIHMLCQFRGMERTARAIRGQSALWLEGQLVLQGVNMDENDLSVTSI